MNNIIIIKYKINKNIIIIMFGINKFTYFLFKLIKKNKQIQDPNQNSMI